MITRLSRMGAVFTVLMLFLTVPIYSQEALGTPDETELVFSDVPESVGETSAGSGEIGTFGLGDLVRMVIVLALVAGAVYGLIALLKRRTPSSDEDADSPIRVLASRKIGATGEVHAVMVGSTVMLLGGNEAGVQRLATIEDKETIDELLLAHSREIPPRKTFAHSFGKWLANLAVPGSVTPDQANDTHVAMGGVQRRLQRLRRL